MGFISEIESISGTHEHVCAIKTSKQLGCWGKESDTIIGETIIPNGYDHNII